jgi:hypothetical protein
MLAGRHAANTRCLHVVRHADTHKHTRTHTRTHTYTHPLWPHACREACCRHTLLACSEVCGYTHTYTHTPHCGPMLAGRHAADARCLHVVRQADTHKHSRTSHTHTHVHTRTPLWPHACREARCRRTLLACMAGQMARRVSRVSRKSVVACVLKCVCVSVCVRAF